MKNLELKYVLEIYVQSHFTNILQNILIVEVVETCESFFCHYMNAGSVVGIPWGGRDTQILQYFLYIVSITN